MDKNVSLSWKGPSSMLHKILFIYPVKVLFVETFNLQKLIYKIEAKIYAGNGAFITEMEQIVFGIILLGWGMLGDFLFNFHLTSNWIKNIAVSKVKGRNHLCVCPTTGYNHLHLYSVNRLLLTNYTFSHHPAISSSNL